MLQNYCTFQCGIKIINRKNPICLVPLETGSLIILPTVFSSSVVPDYQAQKTPVKPNSLQGPVSSQRNKSLEFVQLDTIACNGMNRVCAAIWHNLGWRALSGEFSFNHRGWLSTKAPTALKGFFFERFLLLNCVYFLTNIY